MTVDSTAAMPQTVAVSSLGPSGRSTGTASTAKPTSPAQRSCRPGDARRAGTAPPLDGEGAGRDEQGSVQHGPSGPTAVQERYEDGDDDRGAADEHTGNGGFRGAFRGQDRQIETDHADDGEQGEPDPLRQEEGAQRRQARAAAEQRQEEQAGEGVAQRLAAGTGIVAEDAVGGEGGAHEEIGHGDEQRRAQRVHVHGGDARERGGPA
ncbi:hypothetical protein [Streptomyces sp. NBC_01750]|uniref:hypothetical protein n=1 Tax=Streptomyces sp. NBC_01750 TaxID=2975928 RepID=UPI003FA356AB